MPHKILRDLRRLQIVRDFEVAMFASTGIAFRMVPATSLAPPSRRSLHPFCALMWGDGGGGCGYCRQASGAAQRRAGQRRAPQEITCLASMKEIVLPVIVGAEHVASIFAGPVLTMRPGPRECRRLARELDKWGVRAGAEKMERAFLQVRVLTRCQLAAMTRLFAGFTEHLALLVAPNGAQAETDTVRRAREFAAQVFGEQRISMKDAAVHVRLSENHFSKMFHKATGLTFTDYLAHIRVEKAKHLLASGCDRATEVAFASGFHSIPTFNRVFKKFTGLSPTEYRRMAARRG
jgi:AraC-like DNA-binding protein